MYHTAVLGYVGSRSDRDAFAKAVRQTGAVWISNEAPSVFPELARVAPPPPHPGHFLLAVDGKPVAWTGRTANQSSGSQVNASMPTW